MLTGIILQILSLFFFVIAIVIKCVCKGMDGCNYICFIFIAMSFGILLFLIGTEFILINYSYKENKIKAINDLMKKLPDKPDNNFDKIITEEGKDEKVKIYTEKNYYLAESIKYIANAIIEI